MENYTRSKEWLKLVFNNLEKVIRFYEIQEYVACVFRIQLSIEQFLKSLLFLLGFQVRKTHEPSKILDSLIYNNQIQNYNKPINKLSKLAKIFEKEETSTRNGVIRNEKLIPPNKIYDKTKTIEFLNFLMEFLLLYKKILIKFSAFSKQTKMLEGIIDKVKLLSEK